MNYPPIPAATSQEEAITSLIRAYCGWHVAPEVNEIRSFDYSSGGRLFIPTLRLAEVHRVATHGRDLYDWTFSEDGWVTFSPSYQPPAGDKAVTVEFKHGFPQAPELALVLERVKARLAALPAAPLSYQRAGTQGVGYLSRNGEVLGFSLSDSEKEALAPYRLRTEAI